MGLGFAGATLACSVRLLAARGEGEAVDHWLPVRARSKAVPLSTAFLPPLPTS